MLVKCLTSISQKSVKVMKESKQITVDILQRKSTKSSNELLKFRYFITNNGRSD